MTSLYQNAFDTIKKRTADHELTILHEDGNYRHLRFSNQGSFYWSFDLITWPGSLTIRGDIGRGYTFTRLENMIDFFHTPGGSIDVRYWTEKLERACRDSAEEFTDESALRECADHIAEYWELSPEDEQAANAQLRDKLEYQEGPYALYEAVRAFEFVDSDGNTHEFDEVHELDLSSYSFDYLIAVHAIARGVAMYVQHCEQRATQQQGQ